MLDKSEKSQPVRNLYLEGNNVSEINILILSFILYDSELNEASEINV